jgi:hypothetical protein
MRHDSEPGLAHHGAGHRCGTVDELGAALSRVAEFLCRQRVDAAAAAMHLLDYRSGDLKQVPTRNGFGEGLIAISPAAPAPTIRTCAGC